MSMSILKLENLSKYYTSNSGVTMALSSINLEFDIGEFVAVTGESGSGKSTLAHVLAGIIPYESGELYFNGNPTTHYDSSDWEKYRRDNISFISQSYGILVGNTVLENVESSLILSGTEPCEARECALDILREVELSELAGRRAGKLSSGQKQRLSIARALAKPSKILIADEPTGNLDRENSDKIIRLLKNVSQERLVILITHEFDEARDYVTRHIVISDGNLVSDAGIRPQTVRGDSEEQRTVPKTKKTKAPYITRLTLKSRPVFCSIMCLFIALTMFITFVFMGTFTVALDDTGTKIYDSSAFLNGDPKRIVVMKEDGTPIGEDELNSILSVKHIKNVERRGYIADFSYYYRPYVDYRLYETLHYGPTWHPIDNPNDTFVTVDVEFLDSYSYMRTFPLTEKNILSDGRAPEDIYEIVSADSAHKVGDVVTVYIKDRANWGQTYYSEFNLTVVGTTSYGEGLYFSDKLAVTLSSNLNSSAGKNAFFVPYEKGQFSLVTTINGFEIGDDDYYFSSTPSWTLSNVVLGTERAFFGKNGMIFLTYSGTYKTANFNMILVSRNTFENNLDTSPSNQISVYIDDYSYTDRVIDKLADKGYFAFSPFRHGAVEVDADLAVERVVTLAISFAVMLFTFILQAILCKAMFSSQHKHFRLLSEIGLTSKGAYLSLALEMLVFTLIGETLGISLVFILNAVGFEQVANIFKYLEFGNIMLLILLHILSLGFVLLSLIRSLKNRVFYINRKNYDLDFAAMDEV